MAKTAKKDSTLTLEEKLEQALVPNTEYPYKIPDNWCWTYIRAGFTVTSSKRVHKNDWISDGIPFYRTRELVKLSENGYVDNDLFISQELYAQFKKNYGVPAVGDLLISGVGTIGVPYVIGNETPFYFKDGNVIWFQNKGAFLPKYVYYLYKSTFMCDQIREMSAGTTVDTYTIVNATNTMIPLPPLAEQQRIVDRIESLFAKLDKAKEKAQAVVDGFEDRKAAILHKAFTGKLTAEWRKANGILSSSWCKKRFDEVAEVKSNLVDPADYQDFPHIAPDNIEKKTGRLLEYHTIAEDGMKSGKHRFYAGQILYSKIRPNLSKVIVVDFDGLCSADMYPIEPKDGINTKYLWYYMLSEEFLIQASTAGSRSVLPKINQKELSKLTVMVTDPLEQERIVSILDQLFEKEQQAKEAAEQVIDHIDSMKKSILSRAFRGELGTNDPNDESAIELLKKVLEVEPTPQPRRKGVFLPKDLAVKLKTELERKIVKLFIQRETDTLTIQELISVSSKTFEVLETLRDLESRQIIKKAKDNNIVYTLMR